MSQRHERTKKLKKSSSDGVKRKSPYATSNSNITYVPYDAGGGPGRLSLNRDELAPKQFDMFKRTITESPYAIENVKQEMRQLSVVEKIETIVVNVAREDFPQINADITVKYLPSTAQASWRQFVRDVTVMLDMQFMSDIVERCDHRPVHAILRLRNGGQYLVRQREEAAVLEAIYTGVTPTVITYPVIKEINTAIDELNFHSGHKDAMRGHVQKLITLPATRKQERDASNLILKATEPQAILDAVHEVMTINLHAIDMEYRARREGKFETPVVDPSAPKYDTEVDVVSIHRLALESINRLVLEKNPLCMNNITVEENAPAVMDKVVKAPTKAGAKDKRGVLIPVEPEKPKLDIPGAPEKPLMNGDPNLPVNIHKIVSKPFVDFIENAMSMFRDEADIVVTGFKLLNDLCVYMDVDEFKEQVLDIILDTMQAYAPDPPPDRPRTPKRYLIKMDERLRLEAEAEAQRKAEEEAILKKQRQKLAREKARGAGGRKRREAAVGADSMQSRANTAGFSRPGTADDTEAEAPVAKKKLPRRAVAEEVIEAVVAAPVVTGWSRSKGATSGEDRFKQRFRNAKEALNAGPMTKEQKIRQKFERMKTKPLPVTAGVKFRGLAGQLRKEMTFSQSMASLFKYCHTHYSYRAECFRFSVNEEIAEIAQSCQAQPRVLEYIIWTLNDLYSDGFSRSDYTDDVFGVNNMGAGLNEQSVVGSVYEGNANAVVQSDELMQVSAGNSTAGNDGSVGPSIPGESIDPRTGMVINAVSTVTAPSMDLERGLCYKTQESPQRTYYGDRTLADTVRTNFNPEQLNAVDVSERMDKVNEKLEKKKVIRNVALVDDASVRSGCSNGTEVTRADGSNLDPKEARAKALLSQQGNQTVVVEDESDTPNKLPVAGSATRTTAIRMAGVPAAVAVVDTGFQFPRDGNEFTREFQGLNPAAPGSAFADRGGGALLAANSQGALALGAKGMRELPRGLTFNAEVRYQLGEEIFLSRFIDRPAQDMIIAVSFIANHDELEMRERNMADMWLTTWDDCSRDFRMWKRKGMNMAAQ